MPTLSVTVVDKITNKVINEERPNILLDDSIKKIKEKIFAFHPDLIPNILKIQVQNNDEFITITDINAILYENFEQIPEEPIIYITNLQSELSNYNLETLYSSYSEFKIVFSELKKSYIDLQEEDLLFLIRFSLLQNPMFNITHLDIQDYVVNIQSKRNKLIEKYEEQEDNPAFEEFYKLSYAFEPDVNNIVFNDISLTIIGNNVEYGTKGIFIKLNEIYNILELNENIPFIALGKKSSLVSSKQPQIKIYNRLIDDTSDKEIKSWVLNEKKKLNEATYKIIKGLMIKSKLQNTKDYLTINILPNGILHVNLKITEAETYSNLDNIINNIKINVNKVIDYLNTINGVFLKSKRIEHVESSTLIIDSIDSTIETNIFINRNKFQSLIKKKLISENILELKRTESLDVLSAYYKKFKSREYSEDIKGISINIRDNPYKEESSIIKIFGANNRNQSLIILWTILILNEMSGLIKSNGLFEDFTKKRKIREKTNKKKLKEQGIHFDSRECQAIRQPKLNTDNIKPLKKDGYIINFNNQNYRCDNTNYPYPGFTKSNIVCCFKYNQTGNESYIKNVDPESLNILVEPSNFKIKIKDSIGSTFETFIIKIISEYRPGFNETNSMPRYYYLSHNTNTLTSEKELIPIYNKALVNSIEDEDNIWLDRVTLAQIIYPSASNKCIFKPNLNNRTSLHQPCKEHKKNKFFGYTSKSIPCCFDKERDPYVSRKKKEADITKQYIIQSSDKVLNYKQLGILPNNILTLFTKILDTNSTYYRIGIIQNNSSFLNVLLLCLDNIVRQTPINNHTEFKNYIANYLRKNEQEFNKLNNGDISIKYSNIEGYINYINNSDIFLNWNELIDLLERILKTNILILDTTSDNIKLLCRQTLLNIKKFNRPFIILLKNKNNFEAVVKLVTHTDKKTDIIKQFAFKNSIIKFLTEYYKDSCIKENVYPKDYPYIPIYNHNFLIEKLKNQNTNSTLIGNIKYQIKNNFNKINLLMTKRGVLLPILETGIIDNPNIKVISFSSLIRQKTKLLYLKDYSNAFKAFNKINEKGTPNVKIIGVVDSNIQDIGGLLTNFGVIIPYSKLNSFVLDYPKLDFNYYLDIDDKLISQNIEHTPYQIYSDNQDSIQNKLFNIRKSIGKLLSSQEYSNIKQIIETIISNTALNKNDKIKDIIKIFDTLPIDKDISLFKTIANEIINDNIEKLLLNNIITSDTFNKSDVIIRNTESILLNIDDIRKWIKKHQILS